MVEEVLRSSTKVIIPLCTSKSLVLKMLLKGAHLHSFLGFIIVLVDSNMACLHVFNVLQHIASSSTSIKLDIK